jgi:hypothetical protein
MEDYSILELLQKFDKMTTQVDKLINHYGLKEEKPAEEKPAEENPAEEKPAEENPAEEKPAEAPSLKFIDGDYIWKFTGGEGDGTTINVKIENGVLKFTAFEAYTEYEFNNVENKYTMTKPINYKDVFAIEIKNYDSNTNSYTIREFSINEALGGVYSQTGSLTKVQEKPAEEKPAEEKPAEEKPAEEKPADEKPAEEGEPDVYDLPNSTLKIRNIQPSSNKILDEFKEMIDSDNYNPLPTSITIDSLTEDQKTYIINEIFSKNNDLPIKYLFFYYANNHFTMYQFMSDGDTPLYEIASITPDTGGVLEAILGDVTEISVDAENFILYSSEEKPAEEKSVKRKKVIIR